MTNDKEQLAHGSVYTALTIDLFKDTMQIGLNTHTFYWSEVSVRYNNGSDRDILQQSAKVESKELALHMYYMMKKGYGI